MERSEKTVQKARSEYAPSPNGIPYRVYKMCPKLLRRLWNLMRIVWRKNEKYPRAGRQLREISLLKKRTLGISKQFRAISLLNVEGKISYERQEFGIVT